MIKPPRLKPRIFRIWSPLRSVLKPVICSVSKAHLRGLDHEHLEFATNASHQLTGAFSKLKTIHLSPDISLRWRCSVHVTLYVCEAWNKHTVPSVLCILARSHGKHPLREHNTRWISNYILSSLESKPLISATNNAPPYRRTGTTHLAPSLLTDQNKTYNGNYRGIQEDSGCLVQLNSPQ